MDDDKNTLPPDPQPRHRPSVTGAQLCVYMQRSQRAAVNAEARRRGITISALIRRILAAHGITGA